MVPNTIQTGQNESDPIPQLLEGMWNKGYIFSSVVGMPIDAAVLVPAPIPAGPRVTAEGTGFRFRFRVEWTKRTKEKMSIMSYNGGAVMAMRGKNCVAIAADRRFGVQAQMVTTDFQKIFPMGDRLFIGLAGLATDVQTVSQRLKFRLNLYELKEGRQINPKTFMSMVSNLLYERRFGPYYIEPVIAGLDPKTFEPFVCSLDLIGCPMVTNDFVVSGTCSEQMYGMCESLWEPDLEPEDLFETISQAMLNAVDRDAVSGMGVVVHIIEKDKITTRTLKARMD
ncbi:proteasome subunit beta type-3 [Pelodytes ibericus]